MIWRKSLPKAMGISRSKKKIIAGLPLESKIHIFLHVVNLKSWELLINQFIAILGNPKIFSAMVLAMSIWRTLCLLFFIAWNNFGRLALRQLEKEVMRERWSPAYNPSYNAVTFACFSFKGNRLFCCILYYNLYRQQKWSPAYFPSYNAVDLCMIFI